MSVQKNIIPHFKNNVSSDPHVVILGAGASLAAFPNGDKNGRKLPLMNSLVSTLHLEDALTKFESFFNDFEQLYSKVCKRKSYAGLKNIIEQRTYEYFYGMEIPDEPTLYDYLTLSLRKKDFIATFNWDPLLLQTLRRHSKYSDNLPQVLFLHGNVAAGICPFCNIFGYKYNEICHRCYRPFDQLPLLYPVEKKNYNSNKYISGEWQRLKDILSQAYYLTIYGYSAPSTDGEAKKLMLAALKNNRSRVFSQVDVIDIKSDEEIEENWDNFFYGSHYSLHKNLNQSHLWYHPRRSCDAHASAYLMNNPWPNNPFPKFQTVDEMHRWIEPLIQEEIEDEGNNVGFKLSKKVKS